jgi:cell wall-associated NlpC family hydrolase
MQHRIKIATDVAWAFLGTPYRWGGDDPMEGFDCSGFVVEILKSVGILPRGGDWTAEGLKNKFKDKIVNEPYQGCLVFWRSKHSTRIVHVEYCLDGEFTIGASGGGSTTTDEAAAARQNAYIKVRPFRSRSGLWGFVDPFKT